MRRTIANLAVAATLVMVPQPPVNAEGVTSASSTYQIGDSMTVRATFPYLQDMHSDWYINGRGGRPVSDLPREFEFMRDRVGFMDNIVIALSTNPDPSGRWSKASYEGVIGQIPTTSNVFLVTGYRGPNWGGEEQVMRYARWMRQIARANDNVYIVDWRKHVVQGKVELQDGIHAKRGEGERYWAWLVSRRVKQVNQ